MKYFLTHIGSQIPAHIVHCLRQILYIDSNSKITLCTDSNIKFNDSRVEVVNSKDLDIPDTGDYFRNEVDPLWLTSLQRIFLINSYINTTKENIIHFDNDVLIYKSLDNIIDTIESEVYITPQTATSYIFGFSVIKNIKKFNNIANNIYNAVIQGKEYVLSQTKDQAHEMQLLYFFSKEYITPLPVHPAINSLQNTIFDPITYGQFFGGTNNNHPPGFIDEDHIVGQLLKSENSVVEMQNGKPIIMFKDKQYDIANLHVHGKRLERFTTYDN